MDHQHFDDLTRSLADGGETRRGAHPKTSHLCSSVGRPTMVAACAGERARRDRLDRQPGRAGGAEKKMGPPGTTRRPKPG